MMDVNHLSADELMVEFEVRALTTSSDQGVTEDLKKALKARWEVEGENSVDCLLQAHNAAKKNPRREAQALSNKLEDVKKLLLLQDPTGDFSEDAAKTVNSKLKHIRGRLARIAYSPTLKRDLPSLLKSHRAISIIIRDLIEKKTTIEESAEEIARLEVPVIKAYYEEEAGHLRGASTKVQEPSTPAKHRMEPLSVGFATIPHNNREIPSGSAQGQAPNTISHAIETLQSELEEQVRSFNLGPAEPNENYRSNHNANVNQRNSWTNHFDNSLSFNTSLPLDSKICKDPGTWNLKFDGSRNGLHIERFFFRVGRMAAKSLVYLDSLLDYMGLQLTREALE